MCLRKTYISLSAGYLIHFLCLLIYDILGFSCFSTGAFADYIMAASPLPFELWEFFLPSFSFVFWYYFCFSLVERFNTIRFVVFLFMAFRFCVKLWKAFSTPGLLSNFSHVLRIHLLDGGREAAGQEKGGQRGRLVGRACGRGRPSSGWRRSVGPRLSTQGEAVKQNPLGCFSLSSSSTSGKNSPKYLGHPSLKMDALIPHGEGVRLLWAG